MEKIVIFDGIAVFNASQGVLYNLSEPEKRVGLYAPMKKCLSLLIDNPSTVLAQHVFFEQIWEKDGLPITANTFYQHVARLRRAFEEVGLTQEVIVTIPRKGLSLSDKIVLTFDMVPASEQLPEPEGKAEKNNNILINRLHFVLAGLLLAVSLLAAIYLSNQRAGLEPHSLRNLQANYNHIGDIDLCRVYVYTPTTTLDEVRTKSKENDINCSTPHTLYYTSVPLLHRISLIACTDNEPQGVRCLSYFFIRS